MRNAILWLGLFIASYLAIAATTSVSLPLLVTWHSGNCWDSQALSACAVSSLVLRYWWVAALPASMLIASHIALALRWRKSEGAGEFG